MFVRNLCALVLVMSAAAGCGRLEDPSESSFYYDEVKVLERTDDGQFALIDGTAEAVGVLAFVNDEATSFRMLDIDAKLDRRAARGIIHHRNGPDGIYGSWDDEPFRSIEELDAVKWVGGAAIARLIEHATVNGWVPIGDQMLGVYDGVAFTVTEAENTVTLVNDSTIEDLDEILNRRAAVSLFENGPYASIQEIANVRYVGRSAIRLLKKGAQTFSRK